MYEPSGPRSGSRSRWTRFLHGGFQSGKRENVLFFLNFVLFDIKINPIKITDDWLSMFSIVLLLGSSHQINCGKGMLWCRWKKVLNNESDIGHPEVWKVNRRLNLSPIHLAPGHSVKCEKLGRLSSSSADGKSWMRNLLSTNWAEQDLLIENHDQVVLQIRLLIWSHQKPRKQKRSMENGTNLVPHMQWNRST